MRGIRKTVMAGLVAAGVLAAGPALAQQSMSGWYIGGAIGQSEAGDWCDDGGTPGVTITSCDDKDTAYKAFLGYRINKNFAVEGTYINFGDASGTVSFGGSSASVDASADGFGIAALGILPLSGQFELFGKLGFLHGDSEADVTVGGSTFQVGSSGTELHYGVGAIYNFSRNLGIRAEWENVDDAELSVMSIGLQYRF